MRPPLAKHRQPTASEGPPAHPPGPAYPCCLPALGGFVGWTPREGSGAECSSAGRRPAPVLHTRPPPLAVRRSHPPAAPRRPPFTPDRRPSPSAIHTRPPPLRY